MAFATHAHPLSTSTHADLHGRSSSSSMGRTTSMPVPPLWAWTVTLVDVVLPVTSSAVMAVPVAARGEASERVGFPVEAVAVIEALRRDELHPNLNLDDPEDDVDLDVLVGKAAEKHRVNIALSNSFGFGGHNSSILFKKFEA